jgi:hypothetical protein
MKRINTDTAGLAWGLDGEIVQLSKYGQGWHEMFEEHKLDKKYKIKENYEMFCYMNYSCINAEMLFVEKLRKLEKLNKKFNEKRLPHY